MSKRKEIQDYIISFIKDMTKDENNVKLYIDLFSKMNDKEFDNFMRKLRDKEITLSVIVPNTLKHNITVENNFRLAKRLGFEFFQNITVTGNPDMPDYITPNKYVVLKLPLKRAAQLLAKKASIPDDNKSIDTLSGQVTGSSKASKITLPEQQILIGNNCKDSIIELVKSRGGDLGEAYAMDTLLYRDGMVRQETLRQYSSKVVSTKTFKAFLLGMHIKSTL